MKDHTQAARYLFTDDHISVHVIHNLWEIPAISYATLSQVYFSVKEEFFEKQPGNYFVLEVTCHSLLKSSHQQSYLNFKSYKHFIPLVPETKRQIM